MRETPRDRASLTLPCGALFAAALALAACGGPRDAADQGARSDRNENAAGRAGDAYAPPDFEAIAGYPEGWHISPGWPGPFVEGFAILESAVTVKARARPNPEAPADLSCALPALANYQAWNLARVAEDGLEFFVATETQDIEITAAADIETVTDDGSSVLKLKAGDVLTYLQDLGDGDATVAYRGQLASIQLADLDGISNSATIEDRSDKWARVKCSGGAEAWVRLDDMLTTPGIGPSPIGRFGESADLTEDDAAQLKDQLEDLQRFEAEQTVNVTSTPVEGGTVDD
jgi:hypothetical protein